MGEVGVPATWRLFLALWPDAATRDALAAMLQGRRWPPGAKTVPPPRWHVTLHFIGPVPAAEVPALAEALALPGDAVAEPFTLVFDELQAWPGGLWVLAARHVPPALAALHARLGEALRARGLPVDARRFRPHVTLARRGGAGPEGGPLPLPLDWPVRPGYALVRSQQGYHTLRDYR